MQKFIPPRAALRLVGVLALLLLALPAGVEAQETQDTMKIAPQLRAARAGLYSGYAALDPAAVRPFFADSAVVQFQDQTYTGRQAVDAWITDSMAGLSGVRFGASSFSVSDAEVIEHSSYTVSLTDGSQAEGTSEAVWRRQPDGSWKVVRLVVT